MADELDLLFRALVLRVRDVRPEHLSRPFEVADILRTFVPYRGTRAEVGVETAEDYEVVILRLLSGERGYMFSDDAMQEDLRRELDSGNPDLRALQAYGTAKVTLAQHAMRQVLEASPTATVQGDAPIVAPTATPNFDPPARPNIAPPAPALDALSAQLSPTLAELGEAIAGAGEGKSRQSFQARASRVPDPSAETPTRSPRPGCRFCGQALPEGRDVTFCPQCGQNLKVRRCAGCSAEVEPGWKFCVSCGRASTG